MSLAPFLRVLRASPSRPEDTERAASSGSSLFPQTNPLRQVIEDIPDYIRAAWYQARFEVLPVVWVDGQLVPSRVPTDPKEICSDQQFPSVTCDSFQPERCIYARPAPQASCHFKKTVDVQSLGCAAKSRRPRGPI
jgi:hypothetical protein